MVGLGDKQGHKTLVIVGVVWIVNGCGPRLKWSVGWARRWTIHGERSGLVVRWFETIGYYGWLAALGSLGGRLVGSIAVVGYGRWFSAIVEASGLVVFQHCARRFWRLCYIGGEAGVLARLGVAQIFIIRRAK